jgi:hypothetical protein
MTGARDGEVPSRPSGSTGEPQAPVRRVADVAPPLLAAVVKTRRSSTPSGVSLGPHRAICRRCEVRAGCPASRVRPQSESFGVWVARAAVSGAWRDGAGGPLPSCSPNSIAGSY